MNPNCIYDSSRIYIIQTAYNKKIKTCFETQKIDTQMPVINIDELFKKVLPFNTNEYYNMKIIYEGSVQK